MSRKLAIAAASMLALSAGALTTTIEPASAYVRFGFSFGAPYYGYGYYPNYYYQPYCYYCYHPYYYGYYYPRYHNRYYYPYYRPRYYGYYGYGHY